VDTKESTRYALLFGDGVEFCPFLFFPFFLFLLPSMQTSLHPIHATIDRNTDTRHIAFLPRSLAQRLPVP